MYNYSNFTAIKMICLYTLSTENYSNPLILRIMYICVLGKSKGATRGTKGAEAPFSQVKVEKKGKKFYFLVNFVHTTRSKCYCNTIIPTQLSNFIEF